MNKLFSYLITFSLMSSTCNRKIPFDRDSEVKLLHTTYKADTLFKDNAYVFIFHNTTCNSCFYDMLDKVEKIFKSNNDNKYITLVKLDTTLINKLTQFSNAHIIVDSLNKLPKLGLSFGADLLIRYKNGVPQEWTQISFDNLKVINKMLK